MPESKPDASVAPPSTPPPPSRVGNDTLVNVVIPLLLLAAAAGFVVWMGTVEPETRPPADLTRIGRMRSLTPVRVQSLQSLEQSGGHLSLDVDGTVVPFQEANVAAEIAGRIIMKTQACEAGQYVRQGDLLMKIDPTDYELEVERLTRQKEQEYQALREADQEMANAQRLIDVAKEDIQLQQKEVDRQNSLPKDFASRSEIDQAQRGMLAARQQLVAAENQLDLLLRRRVRLEASERLAATNLRGAQVNLRRTEIRAPIDGVIAREEADVNTFVSRGQPLVVIENTSKAEVSSSIRADQLFWILAQQSRSSAGSIPKQSEGYDLPETPAVIQYVVSGRETVVYRWKGRLLSYDGIGLDPQTRTVPVRILVDNPRVLVDSMGNRLPEDPAASGPAPALVRGMYVRVKLLIRPKASLVVIPAAAMRPGNRVLEFVPDETLLQVNPSGAMTSNTPAANDKASDSAADNQDAFNADEWIAGRVVSRSQITPVSTLSFQQFGSAAKQAQSEPQTDGRTRKFWVCEIGDQALTPDSWVVTSPVGTIDGNYLAARASKPRAKGDLLAPVSPRPNSEPGAVEGGTVLTSSESRQ